MTVLEYVPCRCPECKHRPLADGTICRCPQCQPGEGIDYRAHRSIGELVKITTNRWCATCGRTCIVTSMRNHDGSWTNVCDELHVWKVHD